MRRRLLVFLAICATIVVADPPPPVEARSLLGLLTSPLRAFGHRHHGRHYHRRGHSTRYATRAAEPKTQAAAAGVGAAAAAGAGVAAAAGAGAAAAGTTGVIPASVYWPRAYDDLAGYTFASASTGKDPFWSHGFNDIFAGIVGLPDTTGRAKIARQRASAEVSAEAASPPACASATAPSETPSGAGSLAFKQIEQRLAPAETQRDAFEDLRVALINADQRVSSVCSPSFAQASPPERLKAISDRLWALRQAMLMLRTPLERVYGVLTDQQKARLNAAASAVKTICADSLDLPWPRDQIEQLIQPNDDQRAGLETLRLTVLQMGQAIGFSCPRQPLATPLQRLDAAGDRLNTLLYATMIISRTLNSFYESLTDEQKANFRAIGRSLGQRGQNPRAAEVEPAAR